MDTFLDTTDQITVIHNGGDGKSFAKGGRPYFMSTTKKCPFGQTPQQNSGTFIILGNAKTQNYVLGPYRLIDMDNIQKFTLIEYSFETIVSMMLVHNESGLVLFFKKGLVKDGTPYWGTILVPDSELPILKNTSECARFSDNYMMMLLNCSPNHPCVNSVFDWRSEQRTRIVILAGVANEKVVGLSKKCEEIQTKIDIQLALTMGALNLSDVEKKSNQSKLDKLMNAQKGAKSNFDIANQQLTILKHRITYHETHLSLLGVDLKSYADIIANPPEKNQTHLPRQIAKGKRRNPASSPSEDATASIQGEDATASIQGENAIASIQGEDTTASIQSEDPTASEPTPMEE